jgi:NADH dehydrogenase
MKKSKVVIIGGGFGGGFAAKYLHKYAAAEIEVELISQRNYFVFQPLLPEIASGTLNAQDAVTPLRLMLPQVKIRLAEVKSIDFAQKVITVLQGRKTVVVQVPYDHVVIATGQVTDLSMFPGFTQHSMTMNDLADAQRLRNHVIQCLELADITLNAQLKKAALTFVVAGGGFSGVETMGELVEMIRRTLHRYPNIAPEEIKPILIQRGDRLLPEMQPELSEYAVQSLIRAGVEVRLKTGISSATAMSLATQDGQSIQCMTTVTTIGNGPSGFLRSLDLQLVKGKIPVNANLEVVDLDNVWALGDAALIPMEANGKLTDLSTYAPPTAQFAVREAQFLAKNILAKVTGQSLQHFHYRPLGALASLGSYRAVATIFGFSLTGLLAWIMWRGLYIGMLPGFSTRLRVALNWLFDYFMPRTIVQMAHAESPGTDYIHYAKGEVVFLPGEVIQGFYTVVTGSFVMEVVDDSGQCLLKEYLPGDHWGERILQKDIATTGKVVAKEDGVVLVLKSEDFKRLCAEFKPLQDYFASLGEDRYSSNAQ